MTQWEYPTTPLLHYSINPSIHQSVPCSRSGLRSFVRSRACSACQRAISMAMEVHGAMGISRELGLEQLFRDCRMLPIPDGTNQILALIEGRELTGMQAYRA